MLKIGRYAVGTGEAVEQSCEAVEQSCEAVEQSCEAVEQVVRSGRAGGHYRTRIAIEVLTFTSQERQEQVARADAVRDGSGVASLFDLAKEFVISNADLLPMPPQVEHWL